MREEIVESRGEEEMSGNNEIRLKRKRCTIVRGGQAQTGTMRNDCIARTHRTRHWKFRFRKTRLDSTNSIQRILGKRQNLDDDDDDPKKTMRNFCAVLRDWSLSDSYNSIILNNLEFLKTRWTIADSREEVRISLKELVSRLTTCRKLNRSLTTNQTTVGSNQEILSPEARVE